MPPNGRSKILYEILSDGQWHRFDELGLALELPPDVCARKAEIHKGQRWEDMDAKVRNGARLIVSHTLYKMRVAGVRMEICGGEGSSQRAVRLISEL